MANIFSYINAVGDFVGSRMDNLASYVMKDYAYANSRIKGMKANLLTREQIETMISARSVNELMGLLSNSGYKDDLVALGARHSGAELVELALGRNLARVYKKILKFTPARGRETLGALLERWDVNNLKTILLAKSFGEKREKIAPLLLDLGLLGMNEMNRLMECGSVDEIVEECWNLKYYAVLKEGQLAYRKSGDIAQMLAKLDESYYTSLPSRIREGHRDETIILGLVRAEIDMKNVMNVLRAKKAGMEEKKVRSLMLNGGTILNSELEKLVVAENVEAVVELLRKKYELVESFDKYRRDGSLIHFEIEMERRIVEMAIRSLRTSILSIGVVASFIFLKEEEMNNIRKIVRGIEFGIPKEEIREMVLAMGG